MIKSMTGFGKAEVAIPDKKITVEIRTLNSKQLDLAVKLPSAYRPLEYEIRALAAKALQRGKADLYISVESTARQTRACIDEELFHLYYNQLLKICREQPEIGTPGSAENNALIQSILRLPDVVSSQEESVSEQEHAAVLDAVGQALAHLDEFRTQEGAILIADLLKRIDRIEAYKQEVIPFEKARTEAIRARIRESLAQLQAEVDNNRLEQEMIFYIEKLDITEEKVRLTNHCNYFREVAASEECAGRKLGFIAQEMGREINTMGSKANNSEIQILVVKMMDELEMIKEKVLNILYPTADDGQVSDILRSERFGQDYDRTGAAPAIPPVGIFRFSHQPGTARKGKERRGLFLPLPRGVPPSRAGR